VPLPLAEPTLEGVVPPRGAENPDDPPEPPRPLALAGPSAENPRVAPPPAAVRGADVPEDENPLRCPARGVAVLVDPKPLPWAERDGVAERNPATASPLDERGAPVLDPNPLNPRLVPARREGCVDADENPERGDPPREAGVALEVRDGGAEKERTEPDPDEKPCPIEPRRVP
jgi:hypothetical protein